MIGRIPAAATHDLRRRVLRPDQGAGELARPGDDDAHTAHFGAYDGARLVAVATVMREPEPDGPGDWRSTRPAVASASSLSLWRIRGVATEPDARGKGYGRGVIEACLAHAAMRGGRVAWLNGRVSSAAFYLRLGFEIVGEPFDTPPSGMHHRFRRALDPDAAWIAAEDALRPRVRVVDELPPPLRTFGGFDVAYAEDDAFGALVLLDAESLAVLDVQQVRRRVSAPYAPGFLARREFPLLEALWAQAPRKPDVLFVDGAGTLHPRRIGSATYAGAALDVPTVGITKTPFIGKLGPRHAGAAEVREEDELLGHALWPPRQGKPIFVSAGHRVSQTTALALARRARLAGERLPEPIRAADAEANAARASFA